MKLLLTGMNHHSAPLHLRERFAFSDPRPLLEKLRAESCIDEVSALATCNRVELLAWTREPDAARLRLRSCFARELAPPHARASGAELDAALYTHEGGAAVRHLFRVASALDSMVVGEPQILGQVKAAYRVATEARACGPVLGRLYQRAFACAKRVRRETRIAHGPLSVPRVAVTRARQIFARLEEQAALLLGAGEMIELAAAALHDEGLRALRVCNRTRAAAVALAARFGASAHGLGELPALLARSDVVLCGIATAEARAGADGDAGDGRDAGVAEDADVPIYIGRGGGDGGRAAARADAVSDRDHAPRGTAVTRAFLDAALVARALQARGGRPIFLLDLGVPRNVDAAVGALPGATVCDLDDLQSTAAANNFARRREGAQAEAIALAETQRFEGWLGALAAVPTIRALRARAEAIRQREVTRALPANASAEEEARLEAATRAVVNKLLHAPLAKLNEERDAAAGLAHLEAARTLFALDTDDADTNMCHDDDDADGADAGTPDAGHADARDTADASADTNMCHGDDDDDAGHGNTDAGHAGADTNMCHAADGDDTADDAGHGDADTDGSTTVTAGHGDTTDAVGTTATDAVGVTITPIVVTTGTTVTTDVNNSDVADTKLCNGARVKKPADAGA